MMERRYKVAAALGVVLLLAVGALALYAHKGGQDMQRAAEASGTTTERFDPEAAANQGSTPPGDAKSVGANRTK
jgi:hypothetical protein